MQRTAEQQAAARGRDLPGAPIDAAALRASEHLVCITALLGSPRGGRARADYACTSLVAGLGPFMKEKQLTLADGEDLPNMTV